MHTVTGLDLTALGAVEIVARVHDGRSSAVDVARAHLARIAGRDGVIGAFQACDPARVLAEAGGVDARADRYALPLAGVPVAIADDITVSGYPTRHGCGAGSAAPARRDDELVKRLRAAGAVVLGKTHVPEVGVRGTRSAPGTTRNPSDEARDPGSSGGAAAVAAGMVTLALGIDGGGSIRIPAPYCGLVGLLTGAGVVPLPGGADEHRCGLGPAGPLARTAQDAALMLGVLSGTGSVDFERPGPARIALSLRNPSPVGRLHTDHRAAAIGAAAQLRAGPGGAAVTLAEPPYPHGLTAEWRRRGRAARDVSALGLDLRDLDPATAAVVRAGRRVLRWTPPRPTIAASWRDRMLAWLDEGDIDLLICPAVAAPTPSAGGTGRRGSLATLLGPGRRAPFTWAWNLAGLPAVVAPVLVGGRPVGVQLVGRPGSEAALLAAAARLERRPVPAAGAAPRRAYV